MGLTLFLPKAVAFTVVFIGHPRDYPVMVHKKWQSSSVHRGLPLAACMRGVSADC